MKCARELLGLLTAGIGVLAATAGTAQAAGVPVLGDPAAALGGVTSVTSAASGVTGIIPAGG